MKAGPGYPMLSSSNFEEKIRGFGMEGLGV